METYSEKRILWLWMCTAVGPASSAAERLLDHFGSVEAVYEAKKEDLEPLKLPETLTERLCDKSLTGAGEINAYCLNEGVGVLTPDSPLYPARLARIPDRPVVLYYKGVLTDLDREVCIAEVGTRSMTEYGSRTAYSVAYDLARAGAVVVSGMAKGVDGMAHRGALDAGGFTVAVLGCGIDRAYPAEHAELMKEIIRHGLVITEYRPFTEPKGNHFPQRNRIISGLSLGTVVVEAPPGSGALITAKRALSQGRDVFALPGKIGEMASTGTNELIRDGASIVTSAADILTAYQPLYPGKIDLSRIPELCSVRYPSPVRRAAAPTPLEAEAKKRDSARETALRRSEKEIRGGQTPKEKSSDPDAPAPLSETVTAKVAGTAGAVSRPDSPPERAAISPAPDFSAFTEAQRRILTRLSEVGAQNSDQLAAASDLPIGEVMAELTMLEISGAVAALPGGLYELLSPH